MKYQDSTMIQSEKISQEWVHGKISNLNFKDLEVERLRLAFTLALRLLNSYPRDLGLEELLLVLRSERELDC